MALTFREFVANKARLLSEGGAMPGVGPIHISEIEPTLNALGQQLKVALGPEKYSKYFGGPLVDSALGSVGKKEFSGDIDIAINAEREELREFMQTLQGVSIVGEVQLSSVVMCVVDIQSHYQGPEIPPRERTGKVQIDFMPGQRNWMKLYYHSPNVRAGESNYTGQHRNLLLSILAAHTNVKRSPETIEDGRPLWEERYKWGFNGLVRVRRTPGRDSRSGKYLKKNVDEIVGGPWTDPDDIARILGFDSITQIGSHEAIVQAIRKKLPAQTVQSILDQYKKTIDQLGIKKPEDI